MPFTPPVTVAALHDAYRRGTLRPSDVVEGWLARDARERDAPVWIATVPAAALRTRAGRLDQMLADDRDAALARPLFGALAAVKDNIDVAGLPTTAACPAFAYAPAQSAPVVAALEAAGAIVVGKTNLDQFATGLVGTRSPYGAVPNAFDPRYISGGSSSGSAVAVATGLVHFALGTDTAGSGRVPAGFNNIVGWKPTRGLLSTRGVVPACRSLDCVSIFALTVADAARVFAAAASRESRPDAPARGAARSRAAARHVRLRDPAPRPARVSRRRARGAGVRRCRRPHRRAGRRGQRDRLRAVARRRGDALRGPARRRAARGNPRVLRRAPRRARPDGARHRRGCARLFRDRPLRSASAARRPAQRTRRRSGTRATCWSCRRRPRSTRSRTSRPRRSSAIAASASTPTSSTCSISPRSPCRRRCATTACRSASR